MPKKNILNSLNLSEKPQKDVISKEAHLRNKLIASLNEQRSMAECMLKGEYFEVKVERWIKDKESGERVKKTLPKRLRPWYYEANGVLYFEVRYANRALELAKGMSAIQVASKEQLVSTIDTVINAVEIGELDTALAARIKKKAK